MLSFSQLELEAKSDRMLRGMVKKNPENNQKQPPKKLAASLDLVFIFYTPCPVI